MARHITFSSIRDAAFELGIKLKLKYVGYKDVLTEKKVDAYEADSVHETIASLLDIIRRARQPQTDCNLTEAGYRQTFTVELHTSDYRGDHSADVVCSVAPIAGETVSELVERTLRQDRRYDWLVIRRVVDISDG